MIEFGPSGNSEGFSLAGKKTSEESALWVRDMGLDCFEYSFGRGVRMTDESAFRIGEAFKSAAVDISVHAPYYINFANPDDELIENSYNYVLDSAKKEKLLGVNKYPPRRRSLESDRRKTEKALRKGLRGGVGRYKIRARNDG